MLDDLLKDNYSYIVYKYWKILSSINDRKDEIIPGKYVAAMYAGMIQKCCADSSDIQINLNVILLIN